MLKTRGRLGRDVSRLQAQVVQSTAEKKATAPVRRATMLVRDSYASALALDFAQGNVREVVLAGNVASVHVANLVEGREYVLSIVQDAAGGRTVAWGANFTWESGAAPALTATPGARDNLRFFSPDGVTLSELSRALDVG